MLLRRFDGDESAATEKKIEAGFKTLLPNRDVVAYVSDPARIHEVSLSSRRGSELWDIILWGLLVLVLFEPWLANRISMRHYAQPKGVTADAVPREGRWGRLPGPEAAGAAQEVST